MNVRANPILDQTEEERKAFSLRVQQGRPYRDITPKTTWLLSKIKKVTPFVKFEIIPFLFSCLLGPLKTSTAGHEVI